MLEVLCILYSTYIQVQKWSLLDSDFSIPGGELGNVWCILEKHGIFLIVYSDVKEDSLCYTYLPLGPTLKLKRFFVTKKYAATIEAMYEE